MEPKYSLSEIDAMRAALLSWCGADIHFPGDVDELLRTYMLNGTPAETVIKHANDKEAAAWEARKP